MPRTSDLRARLEAIAAGKAPAEVGVSIVDPQSVEAGQEAFGAWLEFTRPSGGEALAAPADLLAPLP